MKYYAELNEHLVSVFFFFFFFFCRRYFTQDKHVHVRRKYPDNNRYLITYTIHISFTITL